MDEDQEQALSVADLDGQPEPVPSVPVIIGRKPDDIDAAFAPSPRETAESYAFDDELLIVDRQSGRIHVLNPVGALVWECFDGEVTLDELAPELAEAFGAPTDVVLADILAMARQLGDLGLLAGVTAFTPAASAVPGVEVGEAIGPLHLWTSDGDAVEVPRKTSAGTLLINWSPSCGYCTKIVEDLEMCRPGLVERGIDLVLLTVGSDEDNRRVLDPAGLSDAALYRVIEGVEEGSPNPFGSLGTPVAYLLDGEGRVQRPLALGALEVPSLARDAAGVAPEPIPEPAETVSPPDAAEHVHAPARPSLPAAGGMCGPSAQPSGKAPRQWAATVALQIGEYQVGVRSDSPRTEHLLAEAFRPHLIEDVAQVAPNFSVVLGGSELGDAKALSLLLAADTTVVRSRSPRRVISALQARLSALLSPDDQEDGLIRTTGIAVLARERSILLPPVAVQWMEYLQPRLARLGIRLSDEPGALIDPVDCSLVIPEPAIEVSPDVLLQLGGVPQGRSELPPMEPGRYPLAVWGYQQAESSETEKLSRAGAIAALLPAVEGSPDRLGEIIEQLGTVVSQLTVVPLRATSEREFMESIESQLSAL